MVNLRISGLMYNELQAHLFPGDGKEAIAFAICGRFSTSSQHWLLVHKLFLLPYDECEREVDFVEWKTELIDSLLEEASEKQLGVVKFHSHPTGYSKFSQLDNDSDKSLFPAIYSWMDDELPHASVIMLPDGKMFGRVILPDISFEKINRIAVVGDDLRIWDSGLGNDAPQGFSKRNRQAFGNGTISLLRKMKISVIGCSGTGSPVIEQLYRLGVGELVLVDPDIVEEKNLNRIIGSTLKDAKDARHKVDVLADYIQMVGLGTKVKVFRENLFDSREVIREVISSDFVFGCVDSADGRHLLNQISTFYLVPYLDLGVKLKSDGMGNIDSISGGLNFIQPGGSSLLSRNVYDINALEAESLKRVSPTEFNERRKAKYMVDVEIDSPAVISVNMFLASLAVNDLLARIHQFRYSSNTNFSSTSISLCEWDIFPIAEGEPDLYLRRFVGRGDIEPPMNIPELSRT